MTLEEKQINTLIKWVNVRLAPSSIHGIGVFALKDIPKGTKLYMDIMPELFTLSYKKVKNNLPPEISTLLLERWPLIKQGSPFVFPDARYVAYCNHSDDANYDAFNDVTRKDIKAGEEVTEDYRNIPDYESLFDFVN